MGVNIKVLTCQKKTGRAWRIRIKETAKKK